MSNGGKTQNPGRISTIVATAAAAVAAAAVITCLLVYNSMDKTNSELQQQVAELTQKEKQSTVMQHVNAQMEEIANEERRISDEQRLAAEQQTKIALQERQNAERQRHEAEIERQNALAAEQRAVEASQTARSQQVIAEQQRAQAEAAKRVTDTLSYLTLARSLSGAAITQHRIRNYELADLLSYTAVLFTDRYHGDIYATTVYQALAMTSQNKRVWNKHKGSVTDVAFVDNVGDDFLSCSTYGEVMRHKVKDGKLQTVTLFSNPKYDFRDIFIDRKRNIIYALSRTSQMVILADNELQQVVNISLPKLQRLEQLDDSHFILFGEKGVGLFDTQTQTVVTVKPLPQTFCCISRYDNAPLAFDTNGNTYLFRTFDNIEKGHLNFKGQVTAFAESKNQHIKTYGMSDGTIYLVDAKGKTHELKGHRSRISKLKINGTRIYSSSYDGTMNLWLANAAKIEPMTLFTTDGWIINFTYDPQKTSIWTGDQNGNITEALIKVPTMVKRLQGKLKRNLTRDEWAYYVGRNVPYEEIKGKEVNL